MPMAAAEWGVALTIGPVGIQVEGMSNAWTITFVPKRVLIRYPDNDNEGFSPPEPPRAA